MGLLELTVAKLEAELDCQGSSSKWANFVGKLSCDCPECHLVNLELWWSHSDHGSSVWSLPRPYFQDDADQVATFAGA